MIGKARLIIVLVGSLVAVSVGRAHAQVDLMPGLGFGKATGEGSGDVDPGLGLFVAVGPRVTPDISVQLQLGADRPSPDTDGFGEASLWIFRAQIVPAYHFGNEKVDIGIGPSLGLFYMRLGFELDTPFGEFEGSGTSRGFTVGAQAWVMARLSPDLSLGPVLSYGRLWSTKECVEQPNLGDECDDSPDNEDEGYLNLSVALLF